MKIDKQLQGRRGEEFAALYLRSIGFTVIDQNFRIRGGEIDLIAIDPHDQYGDKVLVFIEVKTRSTAEYGEPLESITYHKMRALIRATQFYKLKHRNLPDLMRIDAVSVIIDELGQLKEIELVKNIS